MEAVVIDAGSKLLKAGIAAPDQAPGLVSPPDLLDSLAEHHD